MAQSDGGMLPAGSGPSDPGRQGTGGRLSGSYGAEGVTGADGGL